MMKIIHIAQVTELRLKKVQQLDQSHLAGQLPSLHVDSHPLVFWLLRQNSLDGMICIALTWFPYEVGNKSGRILWSADFYDSNNNNKKKAS